jgi:hypothetical protein
MDQLINLICCLTGIMLFAYWLNYVMGTPLADDPKHVDPDAFLAYIPLGLARARLRQVGKLADMEYGYAADMEHIKDAVRQRQLDKDARRDMIVTGRQLFGWERALLCPVCLHWWLTVIFMAICLTFDYYQAHAHLGAAAFTYLVNHFFIRKI